MKSALAGNRFSFQETSIGKLSRASTSGQAQPSPNVLQLFISVATKQVNFVSGSVAAVPRFLPVRSAPADRSTSRLAHTRPRRK